MDILGDRVSRGEPQGSASVLAGQRSRPGCCGHWRRQGDVGELDHECIQNNLNRQEAGWMDVETAD